MTAWHPTDPDAPTFFYVVDWLPPDFGAVGQYAVIFPARLRKPVGEFAGKVDERPIQ